jgi:hypothetical protein
MSNHWTPHEVAVYDQLLVQVKRDLDYWTAALREQVAEHGEMQGLANITRFLVATHNQQALAGMLAAALIRLSEQQHK